MSDPLPSLNPAGFERDEIYVLLSHPYRRLALRYIERAEEPLTLEHLAHEIATTVARSLDADGVQTRKARIHIELYHNHIPKLADCGLIEYERETGTVKLGDGISILGQLDSLGSAIP